MLPIAALSTLIPTSTGHRKCREEWPDEAIYYERAYNLFLDLILLVFPLVVLCATYFLITKTLWHGIRAENFTKESTAFNNSIATTGECSEDKTSTNNGNYGE
ncbi:unnamed protein product [Hermetia illucens]|uniref:Uncharacterized protein n=1 Tax=Hermetia illucens TaxID=343691 RepID=A0A7R8V125_HERIL|nr:unnamed protein product [Hermetia illucens]